MGVVGRAEPTSRRVHILWVCWLEGWTQSEIGEAIGLSQPTISERLSNLPNLVKLIKSLLDLQGEGLSVLGLVVERLS